ncbi:baseplate J/gp47 family protein [Granulibacter bethesdensis]|uniref:baseplate J/gp47 family protein n=1 Tax=Granulibacter bethesdensis TaxID=364410 RepID=UPI0003F203CF|nr:baseplate J/gp47 family protein [Granulibacter bethesdensis]AHJ68602.1 Mu-like prophage FluMu protein gp47 [Granulibacter bethesdensis]
MTSYGITPSGFIKRRMSDIGAEIITTLQNAFGAEIATQPDTVLGQIVATFAEREAALWEMAEGVYNAMYPATASGSNLDKAVSFTGVTRLQATRSQVYCVLYGNAGTLVPAGTAAPQQAGLTRFLLGADTEISPDTLADVSIGVSSAVAGQSYSLVLNSVSFSIIAASANASAILAQLVAAVSSAGYNASVQGSGSSAVLRIVTDGRRTISVATSSLLIMTEMGTPGLFIARDYGPYTAPANSITTISNTISGFKRILNLQDATPGRPYETDSALRARYARGVYRLGAGTLPSIRASLLQKVQGVTAAMVIENDTASVDSSGRPPHSVECIVEGGEDAAVAAQIQAVKPAGITAYGLNSQTVQISTGAHNGTEWHSIGFTRPVRRYVWINCKITTLSEETFPADGLLRVQQSLNDTGVALDIAQDVVAQRFLGPIYATVSGIASIALSFAVTSDPATMPASTAYTQANISIGARERAIFDTARIYVS